MTATAVDPGPIVEEASSATTKQAFAQFPTGVVGVCAVLDGIRAGFAASSFQTVSWEPALVSICVQNNNNTWNALRSSARIGISVLSENQGPLALQLSSRSATASKGFRQSSQEATPFSSMVPQHGWNALSTKRSPPETTQSSSCPSTA